MSEEKQNTGFEEEIAGEVCEEAQTSPQAELDGGGENAEGGAEQSPLFGGNGEHYFMPYVPFGYTPEAYREKTEIRKISAAVCLPASIMFFISYIWAFGLSLFLRFSDVPVSRVSALLSDSVVNDAVNAGFSLLFFLLPFSIAARAMHYRVSDLVALEKPQRGTVLPCLMVGVGFCMLANITVIYGGEVFERFGVEYSVPFSETGKGTVAFIMSVISTAVVPALTEEFALRGVAFGLLKKYGNGFALIISSIVFGVMHGNFDQMPFAFLVGLVLGYVRIKTGSVWVCCLIHGTNNLISVVMSALPSTTAVNVGITLLYSLLLVAGIIGLCIMPCEKNENSLLAGSHACTAREKYKWFLLSPMFILFLCIYLFESITFFV